MHVRLRLKSGGVIELAGDVAYYNDTWIYINALPEEILNELLSAGAIKRTD